MGSQHSSKYQEISSEYLSQSLIYMQSAFTTLSFKAENHDVNVYHIFTPYSCMYQIRAER